MSDDCLRRATPEPTDNDGEIVSIPAGADFAECTRQGADDFLRGVALIDCPFVCGYPVYAWERGWQEQAEASA